MRKEKRCQYERDAESFTIIRMHRSQELLVARLEQSRETSKLIIDWGKNSAKRIAADSSRSTAAASGDQGEWSWGHIEKKWQRETKRERERDREREKERGERKKGEGEGDRSHEGISIIASWCLPWSIHQWKKTRRGTLVSTQLGLALTRDDICSCFSENKFACPRIEYVRTYVLSFFDHAGRIDACVFLARSCTLRGIILAVNRAVFHGRSRACSRSAGVCVFPPREDRATSLTRDTRGQRWRRWKLRCHIQYIIYLYINTSIMKWFRKRLARHQRIRGTRAA